MEVYLIRHGSTAGNLKHRYVGTTDEELLAESVQQLRLRRIYCPVPDIVFSSPKKRCTQTAGLLFPEAEIQLIEDMRECDFGEFEYRNYEELKEDRRYQEWIDSQGTIAFPGGESRERFCGRCCRAFESACRDAVPKGMDSAAFVVHGGTIMAVLDRYSEPHRDYFDWQVKNADGFRCEVIWKQDGTLKLCGIAPLFDGTEPVGIEDQFVLKKNKKLQCGYTTGTCAAAAAKAAVTMLLSGGGCRYSDLVTPKGTALRLPVLKQHCSEQGAVCAVRKFAGDDPDATDGILVYAKAEKVQETEKSFEGMFVQTIHSCRIVIDGGRGVGRVTKGGLEQPPGTAAINRIPRQMIAAAAAEICEQYGYQGTVKITISVPAGETVAKKTFNPHLGIKGGISILGTGGIVVPMSEEALIASIRMEMQQKAANGEKYILITPGNYGADFIRRQELSEALDAENSMKCSNYVGETIDMAVELGVKGILFVAHIGKFIKVSGGIMNTHSANADCRAELIAAQAMRAVQKRREQGGEMDAARVCSVMERLLASNTTEEAVGILRQEDLLEDTVKEMMERIHFHLQKRCQGAVMTEAVLFSNQYGYLGETEHAEAMMEQIAAQTAAGKKQNTGG